MNRKDDRVKLFTMQLPQTLHRQIKEWALYRNTSMKAYVLEAVIERFKKDLQYKL